MACLKKTFAFYRNIALPSLCLLALLTLPLRTFADGVVEETPNQSDKSAPKVGGHKGGQPVRQAGSSGKGSSSKNGNTSPLEEFELGRYQYCGQDKDCIIAINGCCDCVNGGREVAINKDRLSAFRERFDCLHQACGDKLPDPPCENGVVSCVNHKCNYYDDRPNSEF